MILDLIILLPIAFSALFSFTQVEAFLDNHLPREESFSETESWVLKQLREGHPADLTEFPNEERELSAAFLETIVADSEVWGIPRQGIFIKNARVKGLLDLSFTDIGLRIQFVECQFGDSVNFQASQIQKDVSFDGSIFDGGVNFERMTVGNDVFIDNSQFHGETDFSHAEVGGNFELEGVEFTFDRDESLSDEVEVSFNGMKAGSSTHIKNSTFNGGVDFINAEVGGNLEFAGVDFLNPKKDTIFSGSSIHNIFSIKNVSFHGGAFFTGVIIGNQFLIGSDEQEADRVEFLNAGKQVSFNGMKAGSSTHIKNSTFNGGVDFINSAIGSNLQLNQVEFWNGVADFTGASIVNDVLISDTRFHSPTHFNNAEINGTLEISQVEFTNPDEEADFNGIKVTTEALFKDTTFNGPFTFSYATVEGAFRAERAVFEKKVNFESSHFSIFSILNSTLPLPPNEISLDEFSFQQIQAARNNYRNSFGERLAQLGCKSTNQEGETRFTQAVRGRITNIFGKSTEQVAEPGRLKETGDWTGEVLPLRTNQVEDLSDWEEIRGLIARSNFSRSTYQEVENYYLQNGNQDFANKTYIEYRKRERETLPCYSFAPWWNLFLEHTIGYGRYPGLIFRFILPILLFGYLIFYPVSEMQFLRASEADFYHNPEIDYSSFWYSLDLFLPFVDLGVASLWEPKPESRFLRQYRRIHTILGWILIPIGLLALTGLIE